MRKWITVRLDDVDGEPIVRLHAAEEYPHLERGGETVEAMTALDVMGGDELGDLLRAILEVHEPDLENAARLAAARAMVASDLGERRASRAIRLGGTA